MSEIIKLVPPVNKISSDTPEVLIDLADKAKGGSITEMVIACVMDGEYAFYRFSSLTESLVLSDLLHDSILKGFRQ